MASSLFAHPRRESFFINSFVATVRSMRRSFERLGSERSGDVMGNPVECCISHGISMISMAIFPLSSVFTIFSPVHARKISLSNPFHSRSAVAMHPSIVDSTQVLRGRPLDEVSTHTREELADAVSLVVLWHSLIHEDSSCKFT